MYTYCMCLSTSLQAREEGRTWDTVAQYPAKYTQHDLGRKREQGALMVRLGGGSKLS